MNFLAFDLGASSGRGILGILKDGKLELQEIHRFPNGHKTVDGELFWDPRLPELLLHYKGRNYPQSLSESEMESYESYRQARLKRQAPRFMAELEKLEDGFLKEELTLYAQSLM